MRISNIYLYLSPFLLIFVLNITSCNDPASTSPGNADSGSEIAARLTSDQQVTTADLVIDGGQLLNMVGDEANPETIKGIVIRNGLIEQIIPASSTAALPTAQRTIDGSSFYIIPGLIDSHVHFHPWTMQANVWRNGNLHYGVTTIMDTGPSGGSDHCGRDMETCVKPDPNEWIVAIKEFLNNAPESDGPTMYITGIKLDVMESEYQYSSYRFSSLDEVPAYIEYLVGLGVDAIKAEKGLPRDFRRMIIEEADRHGLSVVGHSKDARESISVGMKFIEHMWPITHSLAGGGGPKEFNSPDHDYLMNLSLAPGLIELMVEEGVFLNPTMIGRYGNLSDRADEFMREDSVLLEFGNVYNIGIAKPERLYNQILNSYRLPNDIDTVELSNRWEGFRKVQAFLKQFSEAGGLILAATDNTMIKLPGVSMHREMQMLADAGITPYRVLLGATRWPAEMIRKDDEIGTIREGLRADILLLGSNPVEDISNTRNIKYVIRKGKVIRSLDDCSVVKQPVSQTCW